MAQRVSQQIFNHIGTSRSIIYQEVNCLSGRRLVSNPLETSQSLVETLGYHKATALHICHELFQMKLVR